MNSADDQSTDDNHRHETLERHAPSINTGGETSTDLREDLDGTTREDQSNIGTQTEERVELLGLINSGDLVGKTPEKHRHDNRAPQFSHHVEKAVGPVANNGNGTSETGTSSCKEVLAVFGRVKHIPERVQEEGESTEEGNEGDNASVEELLIVESVGELGVQDGETNGHGQVNPCLQERNNLSTGTRGGNNEYILGITENGVVEQNAAKKTIIKHKKILIG